ncbi:hypothetical protein COV18_04865 [Candidatus Woesearchaeota archaeon CG10_big_fil_rev_8_21_14_0_10_37_12]|nr:MAG: hypothetical protein COV18_04865 [Candidatus Woesearchaeota archaeon CG10_big_fil_rev_8_21_14_0_10_37_12]
MNERLTDYVRKAKQQKHTQEHIAQNLLAAGWQEDHILQAIHHVEQEHHLKPEKLLTPFRATWLGLIIVIFAAAAVFMPSQQEPTGFVPHPITPEQIQAKEIQVTEQIDTPSVVPVQQVQVQPVQAQAQMLETRPKQEQAQVPQLFVEQAPQQNTQKINQNNQLQQKSINCAGNTCYYDSDAEKSKKYEECRRDRDTAKVKTCLFNLIVEYKELSKCQELGDQCYLDYYHATNDAKACARIIDPTLRKNCP